MSDYQAGLKKVVVVDPSTGLTDFDGGIQRIELESERLDTLSSSLADMTINVKSFGAKGDGVTDDSVAFQNAINSLPNGGEIFCPGKFLVGGLIVNVENISFVGRSKADQLIIKNGTTGVTVRQNKVNFKILTIISQGNKTDGLNTNGILYEKNPVNSIGFSQLENVDFNGFSGYGLRATNPIQFKYSNSYVTACQTGISLQPDTGLLSFGTTVTLDNVYLTSCTKGIDAYKLQRNIFNKVIAEQCTYGIYARACSITLLRSYFEGNFTKGAYFEDCEVQDLFNYSNNPTTDGIQIAFTGAVLASDRGYISNNKANSLSKTVGLLTNFGVDPKYFSAYGNNNNIGLQYGDNIVPLVRGDNLLNPSAWVSNRISEFQGFDQTNQGYKVQGTTAGDNTYGIKQDVTLDNTKQYVIDLATTTIAGTGIVNIKCGSLTVTNGVPFTAPVNGVQTVKAYGIDAAGTPFECYVNAFSLCQVNVQTKYTALAQERLTSKKEGRGKIYMSTAPTTGTWAVGEMVYNSTPAASGYIGWVCTVAGSPGTWKGFGAIQA